MGHSFLELLKILFRVLQKKKIRKSIDGVGWGGVGQGNYLRNAEYGRVGRVEILACHALPTLVPSLYFNIKYVLITE